MINVNVISSQVEGSEQPDTILYTTDLKVMLKDGISSNLSNYLQTILGRKNSEVLTVKFYILAAIKFSVLTSSEIKTPFNLAFFNKNIILILIVFASICCPLN